MCSHYTIINILGLGKRKLSTDIFGVSSTAVSLGKLQSLKKLSRVYLVVWLFLALKFTFYLVSIVD